MGLLLNCVFYRDLNLWQWISRNFSIEMATVAAAVRPWLWYSGRSGLLLLGCAWLGSEHAHNTRAHSSHTQRVFKSHINNAHNRTSRYRNRTSALASLHLHTSQSHINTGNHTSKTQAERHQHTQRLTSTLAVTHQHWKSHITLAIAHQHRQSHFNTGNHTSTQAKRHQHAKRLISTPAVTHQHRQ